MTGAVFAGGGGGGAIPEMTTIRKGDKAALALPSDTLTTISELVPTSLSAGVPEILPVCELMLAHAGSPVALKLSKLPSASLAAGWKT